MRTITIQMMLDPKSAANIKQYFINDGDGDPINIYYAQSAAGSGCECLEQVFEYDVTSVSGVKSVSKIGWRTASWSGSGWDL